MSRRWYTQTISIRFVVKLRARGFGSAACLLPRPALGVLASAPHAVEAPLSKVRLRRVKLRKDRLRKVRQRKRGLAADAKHVRHIPWFVLIAIPR